MSIRDHSFSTYARFSEKLTFLPPSTHIGGYLGVTNINFSKYFAPILNESSLTAFLFITYLAIFNPILWIASSLQHLLALSQKTHGEKTNTLHNSGWQDIVHTQSFARQR